MSSIARWVDYDTSFVRRRYNQLARFFILFKWVFLLPRSICGNPAFSGNKNKTTFRYGFMNNNEEKIVIVGGGIGGLTTALALRRKGFDVAVFEQADELREIGAGLSV